VDFRSVQQCLRTGEYSYEFVRSNTDADVEYSVLVVDPSDPTECICECEGFSFRGHCSHQDIAVGQLCAWREVDGPEKQTREQRRAKICPRCGEETEWIMTDE
jgi:hypothetical protein